MKRLAHTIVDTAIWLIHGGSAFFVIWLIGTAAVAVWIPLAVVTAGVDWALTRPLRNLANHILSRTVV